MSVPYDVWMSTHPKVTPQTITKHLEMQKSHREGWLECSFFTAMFWLPDLDSNQGPAD
jgi:hypothetical protein